MKSKGNTKYQPISEPTPEGSGRWSTLSTGPMPSLEDRMAANKRTAEIAAQLAGIDKPGETE